MKIRRVRIGNLVVVAVVLTFAFLAVHVALQVALQAVCPQNLIDHIPVQNVPSKETPTMASSTSMAYQQSFGFFDDINDEVWKMYQAKARKLKNRNHASLPLLYWNNVTNARIWYSMNYEPLFTCPHVIRVGYAGDGPKWTCDPHRIKKIAARRKTDGSKQSNCLVYSVGSEGRYGFEDSLVDLLGPDTVCEIHVFDPGNYSRPENARRNIHYHEWGLKSSYDKSQPTFDGATFMSFPDILRTLGHENRTIDILKVDCEWCEWYSYKDWIQHGDVRQLLMETHHLPYFERTTHWAREGINVTPTQFFDDLQAANFVLFSKEPNIQGDGDFVEWAYIRLHPDFLHGN